MALIDVNDLGVGMRLAYDIRDSRARLLLGACRPITADTLGALKARGVTTLCTREWEQLPGDAPAGSAQGRAWLLAQTTPRDEDAPAGTDDLADVLITRERDAHAGSDVGQAITPEPIVRTPRQEKPALRDLLRIRSALRRGAEDVVAYRSARWQRLQLRIEPDGDTPAPRDGFDDPHAIDDVGAFAARVGMVRSILARLTDGGVIGAGAPTTLADELIELAERDAPGLLRTAIELSASHADPATRAYCVAAASAALAVAMGWSPENARAAALAGLFADAGAALLTWDIRATPRSLTDEEANAVRRHPAYSAALIERVRAGHERLPEQVQLAVYQHHERDDGSGYPLGLRAERIHDAARLLAVADTLIAMVTPRADRPGLDPTAALNQIARQANRGALWRTPAATLVELAMGRVVVVRERTMRAAA